MAQITITVPIKALPALQKVVDDFNVQTTHTYTLTEWLTHHVAALAIGSELSAKAEARRKQLEAELPRLIEADRRELLDAQADAKP